MAWQEYNNYLVQLYQQGQGTLPEDVVPDPNDLGMKYSFNLTAETDGGMIVASSDGRDNGVWQGGSLATDNADAPNPMFDNFQITVDQLEGEINLPYVLKRYWTPQITVPGLPPLYTPRTRGPFVIQRIEVPRSPLGGFAQFRINYQYVDQATERVYTGEEITPRVLVQRRPPVEPPPPPPVFTIDDNQIREALADKVYDLFFNSETITETVENIKSLQSTQSPDGVGYKTGRESDDDQLIFFKKDRNTPENKIDFYDDGNRNPADEVGLSGIITDISQSYANTDANGIIDLTEKLNNNLTVGEVTPSQEIETVVEDDLTYYSKTFTYNLRYNTENPPGTINLPFASYMKFYSDETATNEIDKPIEWVNKLNLSQLTKPKKSIKVDINKAKNLLDTNIFELLPNQSQRQDEINQFFQKFQALIGNKPTFEDVDEDGAGEAIQDLQIEERISTASPEKKESSYITRLNQEADEANRNKTLQSMRDNLNEYLGDVDNVIEEFPELPEYENKSEGFLKIRKSNQAILIRNKSNISPLLERKTIIEELDPPLAVYDQAGMDLAASYGFGQVPIGSVFYERPITGAAWSVQGFTVTMWVRFLNSKTGGSLMTFGNPILKKKTGFRLDTQVRSDTNEETGITTDRRMVRLVVYEKSFNSSGRIYDSHFGRDFTNNPDNRGAKYKTWMPGSRSAYEEFAAMENGSWHVFMQHTQIPTDNLNEWFFICATYDPTIDEEGSFDDESLFKDTDFWLNKKDLGGNIVANSGFGNKCKVEVISRSDLLRARGFKVD
ncbi:MAG: hypothetical protein CBE47_03595 [Pelagibacteraceae bacterium TMED287]|nr:MAG: hypothetical protein CBE47_03595 [Pelagibacteraceae bacterium TMED287]